MSTDISYAALKSFFETRNAARQALSALKEGVEISLVLLGENGSSVDCALFRVGETPVVERRPARKPDVLFHIQPSAINALTNQTKDEIGDVGIAVIKEVLAGHIKIKIVGGVLNVLTRGYIDMIRMGGAPVMGFLAQRGLGSIPKVIATIKKMRS